MSGTGSSGRAFTTEQKAAVIRVRKCNPTAFYDILGLEETRTTCSDGEIKKAYRKLSLLTHPDKNGYDGSDEAFKMISRAFQILSDSDKKSAYDKYGIDADTRGAGGGGGSGPGGSGFASGFGRQGGFSGGGMRGRGGPMFEEEINPEDIFRQFFGGGGVGGGPFGGPFGGLFDTGPGFAFNMGGGPGVRVHQFGGNRPRRRPANGQQQQDQQTPSPLGTLQAMLPLLLLVLLPLMSGLLDSFFSGPAGPNIRWDPVPPQTLHRSSHRYNIPYYVDPKDVTSFDEKKWRALDKGAEVQYISSLQNTCEDVVDRKRNMLRHAQGIFWTDENMVRAAENLDMSSCKRLEDWGIGRRRL